MFYKFITNIFIPTMRSRSMIPILITPVTRKDTSTSEGTIIRNFFVKRKGGYKNGTLQREVMGAILYAAYGVRFGYLEKSKPKYMTDYNGLSMLPNEQNFDPNLTENASQYYPTVAFDKLNDIEDISFEFIDRIRKAYNLGLIRLESGII